VRHRLVLLGSVVVFVVAPVIDAAPAAPAPGTVTCAPTLEDMQLSSDPDTLASHRENEAKLAADGMGGAECSYVGEPLPGGVLNSADLSVTWLVERRGQTVAGLAPCGTETVIRPPDPVSVASSTKEVTSLAFWNRREPQPESFVVALTDLVRQAEPLALDCDSGDGSGGSGSVSDETGGEATPASTSSGGDDPVALWLAIGLILSLLGIGGSVAPYLGRSGGPEPMESPPEPMPEMPPLPDVSLIPGGTPEESNVEFLDHIVRDAVIDHLKNPPPFAPPLPPAHPPPPPLAVVPPVDLGPLGEHFTNTVHDKLDEGWYVRNPDVIHKIMNNFGRLEPFWDPHSGQCGEFAHFGQTWVKDFVDAHHPGSIVDSVLIEYKPGSYEGTGGDVARVVDSLMPNHTATRIILPDGQRVIADFWDSMGRSRGTPPRLVPESEWAETWGHELFGQITRNADERRLKEFVTRYGEERGLAALRDAMSKAHDLAHADTLIRSWKQDPW
jgi:hypothetical protein